MNKMLRAALDYRGKYGFSVIPIKKNKKPYIPWEEFQKRRADSAEIKQWWDKWPSANVGIVTGKVSNICALDIDETEGFEAIQGYIPETLIIPTCKTPGGGQHLYFQFPDKPLGNNARVIPGCDFRGEGGYVIAPPSIGSNGQGYEWLADLSLVDITPPPLPGQYVSYIKNAFSLGGREKTADHRRPHKTTTNHMKIPEGRRDETLFHIANSLIKGRMPIEEVQQ
ncbi:MAG: hypothetical protein GTO24_18640, partial [candidate division Zixibacteria bacterium]|nr:hypothetical protein [candidate division Zixibacteria bacterium]